MIILNWYWTLLHSTSITQVFIIPQGRCVVSWEVVVGLEIVIYVLMKIKAQRIRGARAFTTYIGNSILIMENSDLGGCETLETPNIFLFPSVLSLLLF